MVDMSFWDFERWSVGWMTLMVWVPRKNRGVVSWDVGIMDGDVKRIGFNHFEPFCLHDTRKSWVHHCTPESNRHIVDSKQLISYLILGNWKSPTFFPKNVSQELVRWTGWGRQRFGEVFDAAGSQETLHCWATPAAPMADDPSVPKKRGGFGWRVGRWLA